MAEQPQLEFEEVEIETPGRQRVALVVTAAERIRVGRKRLEQIEAGRMTSAVDDRIVARLAEATRPVDAVVLRSWDGSDERSWGFDDDLDEDELRELGYQLMRAQLQLYRRVLGQHVHALVSTDLSGRDFDVVYHGALRLSRELAERVKEDGDEAEIERLELWILDHFSLWTTRPFDEFMVQGMPRLFALADRYADKLESLPSRLLRTDEDRSR